ncbi:Peptidyl-prolyl cis-trans isomerase fpr2 [Podochytrium sp. JEL0797]|nr:Peptidyl-prolyl cis-trans isomerase fpr2 [Podochytrium sp. JEL0797]
MRLITLIATFAVFATATSSSPAVTEKSLRVQDLHIETVEAIECTHKTAFGDKVSIHYTGRLLPSLQRFDSSIERKHAFDFEIGKLQTILGLERGIMDMCVGEKRRVSVPSSLGYGSRGWGNVVPINSDLQYDVELLSLTKPERVETAVEKESEDEEEAKGREL